MTTFYRVLFLAALPLLILSCGNDNKTSLPAPAPVIGQQNLNNNNILAPYDPSFEVIAETTSNRNLPTLNGRYFRVTNKQRNGARNKTQAQITRGASFKGDKALQLFNAQNQVIIFPIDTTRKGRPLNLIPGARYRVSAKVRLPRGNRSSSFSANFAAILFSENRMISGDNVDRAYPWPRDGAWLEIAQEFETPSLTQKGNFQLTFEGSSDVIIDDLILVRIR